MNWNQIIKSLIISSRKASMDNLETLINKKIQNLSFRISSRMMMTEHLALTTLTGLMKKINLCLPAWRKKLRLLYLSIWTCMLTSREFKLMEQNFLMNQNFSFKNFSNTLRRHLKELLGFLQLISILNKVKWYRS